MQTLRRTLKRLIGPHGNPLLPARSMEHLEAIRASELEHVLEFLPPRCALLEIGSGSGWQAKRLSKLGFSVEAIDVPSSNYASTRVWPVREYDGIRIPFLDESFDCVFSSNTLEHIPHVREFQREILRVLKPRGVAVHVVPSASWRMWTNFTNPLRYFTPPLRHGEHASNALTEMLYFRRGWWEDLFRSSGWVIKSAGGNGLFYTGCSVADSHLSIKRRRALSRILGSACHVFVLAKAGATISRAPATP